MSFDMYLESERAFIDHHEEGIFQLSINDDSYPQLNWIWDNYYKSPQVSPEIANNLVHELIQLKEKVYPKNDNKHLVNAIDRVLPFFSKAYKNGIVIKCKSD